MERLTFVGRFCDIAKCADAPPGGSCCEEGTCSQRRVWERLKEYEDTGLTPEDFALGLNAAARKKAAAEYYGLTPEQLDKAVELFFADMDGSLVMLPCKVGDPVYKIRRRVFSRRGHIVSDRKELGQEGIYTIEEWPCCRSDFTRLGRTVFLSKEEAEAAMNGGT